MSTSKKSKRHYDSLASYIVKVLKQVHPEMGMAGSAKEMTEALLIAALDKIMTAANNLSQVKKSETVTTRLIQASVRLTLTGELAKHAVSEGTKATTKYQSSVEGGTEGNRN